MAKIRPLMNLVNQRFRQWGIFHRELSIDEAMIKYFGHHSAKQFIKGKPVRFGYKNWMLCSSNGYCYAFDTYCGAKNKDKSSTSMPLGSRVVLDLLEVIAIPSDHIIFFDNYFSSHNLLKILRDKGQRATGTIRDNRTKKCPFTNPKSFGKKNRGYFEKRYDSNSLLLFVRWKDNNTVTMITNYDTVEPLSTVKRWSSIQKIKIDVPQPMVYRSYNKFMGGVDMHDQNVNNYRISIKGKKWWWVLFTHMINMSVVNAWRLHQLASEENMDLLQFQREIVVTYLSGHAKSTFVKKKPVAPVPISIRKQEGGHFPRKLEKQLRCVQCHSRVRWSCSKCTVTLCIERDCFEQYHS